MVHTWSVLEGAVELPEKFGVMDSRFCPLRVLKLCALIVKGPMLPSDLAGVYVMDKLPDMSVPAIVAVACAGIG